MFKQSKKESVSFLKEQLATVDDLNDLLERKLRNEKNLRIAAEEVQFAWVYSLNCLNWFLVNGWLSKRKPFTT